MLCDNCGKREAAVHFKQIVKDKVTELHLCENCAEEKGLFSFGPPAHFEGYHFELADLLAGLAGLTGPQELMKKGNFRCQNCGLSYDDFRKLGRFGCSECYSTFQKDLEPLLKKIHGSNRHHGRYPRRISGKLREKTEPEDLRRELERAIQLEEFEKAAQLRDRIRELERQRKKR